MIDRTGLKLAAQAPMRLAERMIGHARPQMVQRVADVERAQLLLESPQRAALQQVLAACQPLLHALRKTPEHRGILRWAIDVDPLAL